MSLVGIDWFLGLFWMCMLLFILFLIAGLLRKLVVCEMALLNFSTSVVWLLSWFIVCFGLY